MKLNDFQIPGPTGPFVPSGGWAALATPPVVVASGTQMAWQYPGGSQAWAAFSFDYATTRRLLDVIVEIDGLPTKTAELLHVRGGAKLANLNMTSAGRYQLQAVGGSDTSTSPLLVGVKHRITLDVNGTAITATVYEDDTSDEVYDVRQLAIPAPVAINQFRVGQSTDSGVVTCASWPVVATDLADIGPRDYAPPGAIPPGWSEAKVFLRQ